MTKTPRHVRIFEVLYSISVALTAIQMYGGVSGTAFQFSIVHIYLVALLGLVALAGEKRKTWAAWLLAAITLSWAFVDVASWIKPNLWDALFGPDPTPQVTTTLERLLSAANTCLEVVALGFYFSGNRRIAAES